MNKNQIQSQGVRSDAAKDVCGDTLSRVWKVRVAVCEKMSALA